MWIRNQGRTILMDCEFYAVEDHGSKYEVITLSGKSGISIGLGTYSTKEKALKVLNKIRNELNDAQYYEIENNGHGMYTLNTGIRVYTMPDDEDVEE